MNRAGALVDGRTQRRHGSSTPKPENHGNSAVNPGEYKTRVIGLFSPTGTTGKGWTPLVMSSTQDTASRNSGPLGRRLRRSSS
jgi:hypothetical protein